MTGVIEGLTSTDQFNALTERPVERENAVATLPVFSTTAENVALWPGMIGLGVAPWFKVTEPLKKSPTITLPLATI